MTKLTKTQQAQQENDFYLELLQDAINDAKKASLALKELQKNEAEDSQKMKAFLVWAGIESIYKEWSQNEDLHEEDQQELDFEVLFAKQQQFCPVE